MLVWIILGPVTGLPAVAAYFAFKNRQTWQRVMCLAGLIMITPAVWWMNHTCLINNDGATDDPCLGESLLASFAPFVALATLAGIVCGLLASILSRRKRQGI